VTAYRRPLFPTLIRLLHGHLHLGADADVLDDRRTPQDVSPDRVALVDEREAPIGGIPWHSDQGRREQSARTALVTAAASTDISRARRGRDMATARHPVAI